MVHFVTHGTPGRQIGRFIARHLTIVLAALVIVGVALPTGAWGQTSGQTSPLFPSTGNLYFITPVRILDTRANDPAARIFTVGFDADTGQPVPPRPFNAGETRAFSVTSKTFGSAAQGNLITFPSQVSGLLVNVTVIQGTGSGGFITVFPAGSNALTPRPNASTVNPSTPISANFWATGVPQNGNIAVFSTNVADIALDVVGFYSPQPQPAPLTAAGALNFITPVRVLDTRPTNLNANIFTTGYDANGTPITAGRIHPNETRRYSIAGRTFNGQTPIPATATGIIAHVTIVGDQAQGGFVTLLPGNAPTPPGTSTVNPPTPIAFNSWATKLDNGIAEVFSLVDVDVAIDVMGYFSLFDPGLTQLTFVPPVRVVDTRGAEFGGPIGYDASGNPITTARPFADPEIRKFTIAGKTFQGLINSGGTLTPPGSFPADVKGLLINVTITQGAPSGGFVTAYPGDVPDTQRPNASTVNPSGPLSPSISASFWANGTPTGTEAIFSNGSVRDVIVDVVGYYR